MMLHLICFVASDYAASKTIVSAIRNQKEKQRYEKMQLGRTATGGAQVCSSRENDLFVLGRVGFSLHFAVIVNRFRCVL